MRSNSVDIHSLLPQQPPFVMVGALVEHEGDKTITETVIRQENIFVDNNEFTAPGILENIAQSCAVHIGYDSISSGVRIGLIGAIKGTEIKRLPLIGETITTTIEIQKEILGMTIARAKVESPAGIIAEGEIKLAIDNETANN